jgi:hypothetical protein
MLTTYIYINLFLLVFYKMLCSQLTTQLRHGFATAPTRVQVTWCGNELNGMLYALKIIGGLSSYT